MRFRLLLHIYIMLLTITCSSPNKQPGLQKTLQLPNNQKMVFNYIPPGSFMMGSEENEEGNQKDEVPKHEIRIEQGFYLGTYEVTQAQWESVMNDNPSIFKSFPESPQHPVEKVSWNDVQAFLNKLNKSTNAVLRLPTEAEWEYSCRAGTTTRFYWGEDEGGWQTYKNAWANPKSMALTHPVGKMPPNPWGLYDMAGNVWEWCADEKYRYDDESIKKPDKIFRGGSWFDYPDALRSANRHAHPPDIQYTTIGFRVLMELD
ncbi:MAG: formylglycine-generating enzyme family protein [Bacteroidota bacterium]